jgi:endonuclease/exonuclease/phosphatase family metal-dependent hydrolase
MLRIAIVAATVLAVLGAPAVQAAPTKSARHVEVMTRNVYLGGNIGRPISGTAGCQGQQGCLYAFATANNALWNVVVATDFPARAKLLAAEIAATRPDLIGLQEVATWRTGPMQLNQVTVPNATTVQYDFLAILMAELHALGAGYEVVRSQQEADIEGPAFNPDQSNPRDVRLTMSDVILKRTSRVQTGATGGANYASAFTVPVAGLPVTVKRGYVWADAKVGKHAFRFINTHLESFVSAVALAQAQQLVSGPAATKRAVVLVGDFNSDPLDGSSKPGDIPHWSAYRFITGAGGFTDTWPALRTTSDPGWTSGLSERVNDAGTSTVDHRIDMVFARGADGDPVRVYRGEIVGLEARTPGGLWASDHMGVVVSLKP